MDAKDDWQAVSTWPDFILAVDFNSGLYRRVYRDGRIAMQCCKRGGCGWAVSEGICSPSRTRQQASAARQ
ncbi:TPA: hypothetical protein RQN12_002671 [Aeromonas dhakensis]|nr:hypothetical protein [Aeromonas dhakensis]